MQSIPVILEHGEVAVSNTQDSSYLSEFSVPVIFIHKDLDTLTELR